MNSERVRYRERQILRLADLETEQDYRIVARRLHQRTAHSRGIVRGLTLEPTPGGVLLRAGMAIDDYGHELIVPHDVQITRAVVDAELRYAGPIDLWLLYYVAGTETRRHETVRLRLTPADAGAAPPLATTPDKQPVIYLGRIVPDGDHDFQPVPEQRATMITLTGAVIASPQARDLEAIVRRQADLAAVSPTAPAAVASRIELGATAEHPHQVFAVRLGDRSGFRPCLQIEQTPSTDATVEAVDKKTAPRRTTTTVTGNVRLGNTKCLTLGARDPALLPLPSQLLHFAEGALPPTGPREWSIYRCAATTEPAAPAQLRCEIADPGTTGDPAQHRFAVGAASADGIFHATLSVNAAGTITMAGLKVEGQLIEIPTSAASAAAATGAQDLALSARLDRIDTDPVIGVLTYHYRIVVQNVGAVRVTGLIVYQTVVIAGQALQTNAPVPLAASALAPGDTIEHAQTATATAGQAVLVACSATGTSSAGAPVYSTSGVVQLETTGGS
jgi:hypothetical protein